MGRSWYNYKIRRIERTKKNKSNKIRHQRSQQKRFWKVGLTTCQVSDLEAYPKGTEFFEILKENKNDLVEMVFAMILTYNEIDYMLDKKRIDTELKPFSHPHDVYKFKEKKLL